MNINNAKPPVSGVHPPASTPRPSLRDAFNMSAASMGVLASMPAIATPLSMAAMTGASGIAAALAAKPENPPSRPPRENPAHVFNPASMTGVSLLHGLQNSMAGGVMQAAAEGDAATLGLLLDKHDVLPDFTNGYGISPLIAAAARGQAVTLELLAAHPLVSLARADDEGWTALHFAAHLNQRDAVAILLKHHAPFDMETAKGQIAFDLGDAETQAVFLQDKNFKRFLKLRNPAHALLQPPPVEAEEMPEPETQPAPLPETFYEALTDIGLALQKGSPLSAHEQLNAKLAKMDTPNLAKAYRGIAATNVKYDWDDVFIRAAEANNTAAMVFLQDEIYFEQRVLDRALAAAAKIPASRNAVHHLVVWAANPHAKVKDASGNKAAPIEIAYAHGNFGAIEEIVLWTDKKETAARIEDFVQQSKEKVKGQDFRKDGGKFMAMISIGALLVQKKEMAKLNADGHRQSMAQAVQGGNITNILAAYAQGQMPRFMHGPTAFSREDGAAAMAWALVFNRIEFARKLAADGYRIGNAPASLQEKVSKSANPDVRAFARENLMNTTYYPRIEETGKRTTSPSAIRQMRTGLYLG